MDTAQQSQKPLKPTVIVGLGNDIAGDDGAGIAAAGKLSILLADDPGIDVITLPWAGFALLDALVGRRRAVIIDCLTSGACPVGSIVRLDEHHFDGSVRLNSFHDINYPTALQLGRRLGWSLPDNIFIWAIEAERIDEFTDQLTPVVAVAVDRVVNEILRFLKVIPNPAEQMTHAPDPHEASIGMHRGEC